MLTPVLANIKLIFAVPAITCPSSHIYSPTSTKWRNWRGSFDSNRSSSRQSKAACEAACETDSMAPFNCLYRLVLINHYLVQPGRADVYHGQGGNATASG